MSRFDVPTAGCCQLRRQSDRWTVRPLLEFHRFPPFTRPLPFLSSSCFRFRSFERDRPRSVVSCAVRMKELKQAMGKEEDKEAPSRYELVAPGRTTNGALSCPGRETSQYMETSQCDPLEEET